MSGRGRLGRRAGLAALALGVAVAGARAHAQEAHVEAGPASAPAAEDPIGRWAAPSAIGRVGPSGPRRPGFGAVAARALYGRSDALVGTSDVHHRAGGALLLELAPLSWLAVGLRLDGRYDAHTLDDGTRDSGWVGEPRLHAQVDRALGAGVSGGLRAAVTFPGNQAPSFVPGAAVVDVVGLLTLAAHPDVRLTALAGYRKDGSAASVDDAGALTPGDRSALMVSSFDAALVGVGATYRHGAFDVSAEGSADLLLGAGAPAASASPMRVGAGVRGWVARSWALEAGGELLVSRRPALPMGERLVPLPPRFSVLLGAVATFGAAPRSPARPPRPTPVARPAAVRGRLATQGRIPRGLHVQMTRGEEPPREVDVGDDGAFQLDGIAPGPVVFTAKAPGWSPARAAVVLAPGALASISLSLTRTAPAGQIRGVVRSFNGKPVTALVRITPRKPAGAPGQELRSAEGRFSQEVVPGAYEVAVEAAGFEPQTRVVSVEDDGVTVLNIDLRRGRR